MNGERYLDLSRDMGKSLTEKEVSDGWHFCPDRDFMLIHTAWDEIDGCACNLEEVGNE